MPKRRRPCARSSRAPSPTSPGSGSSGTRARWRSEATCVLSSKRRLGPLMEAEQARLRGFTVSRTTFRRLSYLTLALLFAIVVSGATVRLTASGLGCENWPRCGDTFLPEKDFHALIEFGNRVVALFAMGCTALAALA